MFGSKITKISNLLFALVISALLFLTGGCLDGNDSSTAGGATQIVGLTTNYQVNPLGIETDPLGFGWKMQSDVIGQAQAAYQIRLTMDEPDGALVWDSGKVEDGTSVAVAYNGPVLAPETRYYWTVTVTDVGGGDHVSKAAYFETGAVWGDAQWITLPDFSADDTALLFRTEQALKGSDVASARLYMTALGVYDAYINGEKVLLSGKNPITAPGAQEPEISDTYQTYDVTDYIKGSDRIALGALVGNGYYGSAKGGYRDSYAIGKEDLKELCLLAKLVIRYADGSDQIIVTSGDGWTVSDKTPLEANHLVKGEVYNAAIANKITGWNQTGYDVPAADWQTPQVLSNYSGVLHASADSLIYDYKSMPFADAYVYDPAEIIPGTDKDGSSPTKYGEVSGAVHFEPGANIELKAGKVLVLDFGQNCTSMPDIILSGPAGATLNMQPGETVSDGEGGGMQGPGGGGFPGGGQGGFPAAGGQGQMPQGMPQGGQGGMPQGGQGQMPQGMAQGGPDGGMPSGSGQGGFPVAGGQGQMPQGMLQGGQGGMPQGGQGQMPPGMAQGGGFPGGFPGGRSNDSFPTEFDGSYTAANAKDEVLRGVVGGRWVYKLAGSTSDSPEHYRAQFHYGGHRYLQLTSDQDIIIYDAKNIAVSSVGDETIAFESSNKYVDQFVSNTKWSQISNYISVPTDCPTREYRGWTGDANVFAATAFYTFDSSALFHHYNTMLQEYCLNQYTGKPVYGNHHPSEDSMNGNANGNGWTDVGITFPWEYYLQTGDISVLEYSWKAMCAFMDNINAGTDFSDPKAKVFKYGYSDIGLSDHNNKDTAPTKSFLAAAYAYYDNLRMTKMAKALGDTAAVKKYGDMEALGRRYMIERYLDKDGNVLCATMDKDNEGDSRYDRVDNAQTALAWMILLDLYDTEAQLSGMANKLSKSVRNENQEVSKKRGEYTLSVGFLGANVLMPALGKAGQLNAAYGLMTSSNPYGLIYSVTKPYVPATTAWEVWALWEEGSGYKTGESQNHYSYGAPAQWLYQNVLGIERDEENPGFKHFILQPTASASLGYAKGSYDSYYGEIDSAWTADGEGNMTSYSCTVPANTTATLYLPVGEALVADFKDILGLTYLGREVHNGVSTAKFSVLSGRYELSF